MIKTIKLWVSKTLGWYKYDQVDGFDECIAKVRHNRIELIIDKSEKGYKAFADVLSAIEKSGCQSWYGDVTDEKGKERDGLVITRNHRSN